MNTEILIIDDNFDMFDPLVIELQGRFPDANVTVQTNPNDGLSYVLANLSKKIIVLLDYNFKTGQPKGDEILSKIREKTSLIYVIIMTAQQFSSIQHDKLVDIVNNDALAVVQNTVDVSEILEIVSKAEQQLSVRVDCVLEQWIANHSEDEQSEPYITTASGQTYTLTDILTEIRQQTEFGKKMERNILMLAVDLLTRGKKQVDD
jgi:DNA-binding NtrC family response regulator